MRKGPFDVRDKSARTDMRVHRHKNRVVDLKELEMADLEVDPQRQSDQRDLDEVPPKKRTQR
jgi:hypothetical protein